MRTHTRSCSLLIIVACLMLLVPPVFSASIKDRMAARIPAITQLKDSGILGENNRGFLEFRGAKTNEKLVSDENKDRAAVYKAIAKKQGAPADLVGKRRAKMIAQKGKPKQWFQNDDGSWYQK